METKSLHTYLQDHIAGAESALIVIRHLNGQAEEPALLHLLQELLEEVTEDKVALERLAGSLGTQPNVLKNSAAWIGAQVVDVKARAGKTSFGAFEGLEFISLGIQGKLHLWKALQRSASCATAGYRPDLSLLIQRGEAQHERVEVLRLALASVVL